MPILKSQRGSFLIEVVIATAILIIVTMGTMNLTTVLSSEGARGRFYGDISNDLMELRTWLGNEAVCTANLKGKVLTSSTVIPEFQLYSFDKATNSLISSPLVPSKILKGFTLSLKSDSIAALKVRFVAEGKVSGPDEVYREISLSIEKDASDAIVKCAASPLDSGAASDEKIRCYGQSGGLNSQFPNPYVQCSSQATWTCGMVPNCVQDTYQVLGVGFVSCAWTCKYTK